MGITTALGAGADALGLGGIGDALGSLFGIGGAAAAPAAAAVRSGICNREWHAVRLCAR